MKTAIIIGLVAIVAVVFFKALSGEKERIKTLFRIYRAAKQKSPNATERELLETVVEEHIPQGKSTQLRNVGMSGKQYLDGVFESKQLDVDELIEHIIALEFPNKYKPHHIDLDEMFKERETGKLSPRNKLKLTIKNYHKEFLQ